MRLDEERDGPLVPLILGAAWVLFAPVTCWGGGVALYETSGSEVGTAAAGAAARAQDAGTVFTNPAGMTRLEGTQLMFGLYPLYGDMGFNPDGNTSTTGGDGGNAIGLLPGGSFFLTTSPTDDLRLGFGSFSYFGSGLDFDDDWVGRYYVQESDLLGFTLMPAAAYRINEWLSIGAGLNAMFGMLVDQAAVNNVIGEDGRLEVEDGVWGFGANTGVLIEPREGTRFGITYLSPVDLDFKDTPDFDGLGPGLETILGARGLLDAELGLDITVPQMVMLSAYQQLHERWAVMGNVGWQDWSEFGKVDVSIASDDPTSLTLDQDYKDTWHAAVGAQYRISEPWLLSAGVAYDSSAVDDEDRTVTLPIGEAYRFGLGAKYDWTRAVALGLAYELVWVGDLPVDQERGPLAGKVSGDYEDVSMHILNLNLTWKF